MKLMHLRLAVGKSEDEVGDVVLSSFVLFTLSSLRFSVILSVINTVRPVGQVQSQQAKFNSLTT